MCLSLGECVGECLCVGEWGWVSVRGVCVNGHCVCTHACAHKPCVLQTYLIPLLQNTDKNHGVLKKISSSPLPHKVWLLLERRFSSVFLFFCSLRRFRKKRGVDEEARWGSLLPSRSTLSLLLSTLCHHFPPPFASRRKQTQNLVFAWWGPASLSLQNLPGLLITHAACGHLSVPTNKPWPLQLCALPGPLHASNVVSFLNHHYTVGPQPLPLAPFPPTMAEVPPEPCPWTSFF